MPPDPHRHGLDTLKGAAPTHVASVRRHFVDRLTSEDLAALEHVAAKLDGNAGGGTDEAPHP